jgi:membrane protein required for colicin V production
MNWLDIAILVLVVGSGVSAFRKGFSRELVGLGAAIVGLVLGSWFYGTAGSYVLSYVSSKAIANLLGFLAVFCAVLLAGSVIGRLMKGVLSAVGLSVFDRLAGAGFGLLRGALLAIVLVMAMMAFSPGDSPPRAVVRSAFSPYVLDAAGICASIAPFELNEGFRDNYRQVKAVWRRAVEDRLTALPLTERIDSK